MLVNQQKGQRRIGYLNKTDIKVTKNSQGRQGLEIIQTNNRTVRDNTIKGITVVVAKRLSNNKRTTIHHSKTEKEGTN